MCVIPVVWRTRCWESRWRRSDRTWRRPRTNWSSPTPRWSRNWRRLRTKSSTGQCGHERSSRTQGNIVLTYFYEAATALDWNLVSDETPPLMLAFLENSAKQCLLTVCFLLSKYGNEFNPWHGFFSSIGKGIGIQGLLVGHEIRNRNYLCYILTSLKFLTGQNSIQSFLLTAD